MTAAEVIARVKTLRDPAGDESELLRVIGDTEAYLYAKVIAPRDAETPAEIGRDTELAAPRPWDQIYVLACLRHIDRRENQITNMNNEEREFKEMLSEFGAWWTRTHRQPGGRMWGPWFGV